MRRLLVLLTVLLGLAGPALALTPGQRILLLGNPKSAAAGSPGSPLSVAISSLTFTSTTDLTPSQLVAGWTADVTLASVTKAGSTSAYNFGSDTPGSNKLNFTVQSPGYICTSSACTENFTTTRTIYADAVLRETYPNGTSPTEAQSGANAVVSVAFNDYVFNGDVESCNATFGSGLYTDLHGVVSLAKSGVCVTNNSTTLPTWPTPICAWVTPPAQRYDGTANVTNEIECGHQRGIAGALITATDAGSHSISHVATALAPSKLQTSTTCTFTNGSAQGTSCSNTSGFIVGERVTVPGVPGEPMVSAITSSTITLGAAATCVTTLNSGTITINGTPATGTALADGAFNGASISDTNVLTPVGVASITARPLQAAITYNGSTPLQAQSVALTTNATVVTAASAHACTINHVYQGTTGTQTITAGNPAWDYQVIFTTTDFASLSTDGILTFRAQAYPSIGSTVLDSQVGYGVYATGNSSDGCDWQALNVGNCASGQKFATNGTDVSPNFHSLWAYLDSAKHYSPVWVWVDGTGGGTPTVSTSSAADPGAGTGRWSTAFAAISAIKTANNVAGRGSHNDINGAIFCFVNKGSAYAGFGGNLSTSVTSPSKPGIGLTSATAGGNCSLAPSSNSDLTVQITNSSNDQVATNTTVANLQLEGTTTILIGADQVLTTAFPVTEVVFNNDWIVPGGAAVLSRIGLMQFYNNLIDESGHEGNVLKEQGSNSTAAIPELGNTIYGGSYTANVGTWYVYGGNANVTQNMQVSMPPSFTAANSVPQPLSQVFVSNKFMGQLLALAWGGGTGNSILNNALFVNNVCESDFSTNGSGAQNPCVQQDADNTIAPSTNIVSRYNSWIGSRYNFQYLEGTNLAYGTTCANSGGSLTSGTYNVYVTYGQPAGGGTETSISPMSSCTTTGTGTVTIKLQPDNQGRKAWVYLGTGSPPTTYGQVGGVDQAAITIGNGLSLVLTTTGSSATPNTSLPQFNEIKTQYSRQFDIYTEINIKGDYFNAPGFGQSGARVGNWDGRFGVNTIGQTVINGNANVSYPASYQSWYGDYVGYLGDVPASQASTTARVSFADDRSWGDGVLTGTKTPTPTATGLAFGNYCILNTSPHGLSQVPAGSMAWSVDILGNARLNDGTGAAGAYEVGCQ